MKSHGFSLIELTMVMILISVLAVIAFTALPSRQIFQVQGSAGSLRADLNLTKSIAMAQNQPYRIVISANSYQIINNSTLAAIVSPGTNTTTFQYPTTVNFSPIGTITFDSLGKPYSGAGTGTPIASASVLTVTSNGATKTVTISPETGFVQ